MTRHIRSREALRGYMNSNMVPGEKCSIKRLEHGDIIKLEDGTLAYMGHYAPQWHTGMVWPLDGEPRQELHESNEVTFIMSAFDLAQVYGTNKTVHNMVNDIIRG